MSYEFAEIMGARKRQWKKQGTAMVQCRQTDTKSIGENEQSAGARKRPEVRAQAKCADTKIRVCDANIALVFQTSKNR
jgi:hypothetical protein